jgi:Arc/MetJ family transcription regulator
MRTNIVLNDDLVREATMLTGITTKRELVEVALRELIKSKKKKDLFDLKGQIDFADDYDHKSARALRSVAEDQAEYDPD